MMNEITTLNSSDLELPSTRTLASHLISIRQILETNEELQEIISSVDNAIDARDEVTSLLRSSLEHDADTLHEAVGIILKELDELKGRPPSLYLVDEHTGKLLIPINDDAVVQLPDYIGEDGITRQQKPILHPGISSSLAMVAHHREKQNKAIEKSKQNKATENAYTHLINPEKLIDLVKEKILPSIITCDFEDDGGTTEVIEFGREQINGVFQSSNMYFHRVQMFASTLAHKIIANKPKQCAFGVLENKHDSKQQWYSITVKLWN